MEETPLVPPDRLDSWKAIAEYLGRDVATVRRWEKTQGLPVRRVRGGRGRSVFAYRSEIDKWLQEPHAQTAPTEAPGRSRWRWTLQAAAILVVIAGVTWRLLAPSAEAGGLAVEVSASGIVARGPDGRERWRHVFPVDARVALPKERTATPASVLAGRHGGVVVGTSHRLGVSDTAVAGGELLWLSADGKLERTFSFDDRLAFGGGSYAGPWAITDYRIDEGHGSRRFAVAAHHFQWWPSVVSVLDERWQRTGTFVNAGWVERVQWLSPDRLLIAGFSNARDGGMVALLDANALDGQSPPADDPGFRCTSCGTAMPIRYVVVPRSELNLATASPFNRARVELLGDRLVVQTVEVPESEAQVAGALYEFSRTLELRSASFGDRYWVLHRSLEAAGKIRHPRERCPERDGPRAIELWERATGWTKRAAPARP